MFEHTVLENSDNSSCIVLYTMEYTVPALVSTLWPVLSIEHLMPEGMDGYVVRGS
jgi:hypothetical protein